MSYSHISLEKIELEDFENIDYILEEDLSKEEDNDILSEENKDSSNLVHESDFENEYSNSQEVMDNEEELGFGLENFGTNLLMDAAQEDSLLGDCVNNEYSCKIESCDKSFRDQASLRKHVQTHGERQFICPEKGCGKKFLDNSKLKRHRLVHTGEKPYK